MPSRPPIHRPAFAPPPGQLAEQRRREIDRWRGSRSARGYDRAWQRCREAFLRRHPLCGRCYAVGLITEATQVHHREAISVRPDLRLDPGNLEALCAPCHSRETAANRAARRGPG